MCGAENQIQGFLHTGKYSTTAFQSRPILSLMSLVPSMSFNSKRKMGAAMLICSKDNGCASSENILS